ncbi:MAG: hypothetical protein ACRD01_10070 [Terriglobales bacterium]
MNLPSLPPMPDGLSLSDRVRALAALAYLLPARKAGAGDVRISAGDIHRALGLQQRIPLVCAALRSQMFLRSEKLELLQIEGPPSGLSPRTAFTYRLLPFATSAAD